MKHVLLSAPGFDLREARHAVPGETVLSVSGIVPSKKNSWKRGDNGTYIPPQVKADIDALIFELKSARNKAGVKGSFDKHIWVRMFFFIDSSKKKGQYDLDNMVTTMLDAMQSAGIITNDKYVDSICSKIYRDSDRYLSVIFISQNE